MTLTVLSVVIILSDASSIGASSYVKAVDDTSKLSANNGMCNLFIFSPLFIK
jgi:hypothetical protein